MFDIELIRNNLTQIKEKMKNRNMDVSVFDIAFDLDVLNRKLKTEHQNFASLKNNLSKEFGIAKSNNNQEKINELTSQISDIKNKMIDLEQKQIKTQTELKNILVMLPNMFLESVPIGKDENDNVEVYKFLDPTKFNFEPKPHWELAEINDLIDFERSSKVCGSRFIIYKGMGAKLIRALQLFTIDNNVNNDYYEILPPCIVTENSLYSSGQLPKFKEDVYELNSNNFLSPTAEVQLLNMHTNEILNANNLPIRYTANTSCFRSEAGSAGKDTRGVIRQHQFWKSELVTICLPEESENEHLKMINTAQNILKDLNLPFRRIVLCTGDMGFASAITHDIEVWLPSYNAYKEISSCSNCTDFQARRAMIRFKKDEKDETKYVHTLNGSSLAIDRLWAAVVENNQNADGSINIPEKLIPYMNGITTINVKK